MTPPKLCRIVMDCEHEIPDEPKVPCALKIFGAGEVALYDGAAGVELRGRSSLGFPKHQYSIELRSAASSDLSARGETWRYFDGGVLPAAGWADTRFDDSTWSSGQAPLGYGNAVTSTLSFGPNPEQKHITTYFRRTFQVAAATDETLDLQLCRDDGAVVYINGQEVLRSNLPAVGQIAFDTPALDRVEDGECESVAVPGTVLVRGRNVIAVEVHQAAPDSSDISFDLELSREAPEVETDLFGFGKESDWVLNGAWADKSLFRNKLAWDLFSSFGGGDRYAPQSAFCEMTLNDEWLGIYVLGEKVKRSSGRVALPKDSADDGAFIVKQDDEGITENVGAGDLWKLVYPRQERASAATVDGVRTYLQRWHQVSERAQGPETEIFDWLDMSSAVDFVLLEELMKNVDAYSLSLHLWRGATGRMKFVPWDFDLSVGQPAY